MSFLRKPENQLLLGVLLMLGGDFMFSLNDAMGKWLVVTLSVGQVVDCMVTKTNKGGLEVTVSNLRGFLPAGQVDLGYVQNLETFVGQKLRVQVTEVNPKKRNLVVSRRALLMLERKDAEENLWACLPGANKIVGLTTTGRFVELMRDPSGRLLNQPTSIAFGGPGMRDIYIGSMRADYVLKARSPVPGLPLYHQRTPERAKAR